MKIYLGGAMFTLADVTHNLWLANVLRKGGFSVYCPNENMGINDKTRDDLTGEKIYNTDIKELESCNVFLCQISEDSGTMWEAGYMDCLSKHVDNKKFWGVVGLATDIRLKTVPNKNQQGIDNQCGYLNQFVIGGIKCSLGVCLDVDSLLIRLREIKTQNSK